MGGVVDKPLEIKQLQDGSLTVEEKHSYPTIELVDLGLPSGTLWAKTNIGAETETDAGLHFAWGETSQHEGWPNDRSSHPYDWNNYKFGSDYAAQTKYNATDNKTVLDAVDDIATVTYGAGVAMPTKAQFQELLTLGFDRIQVDPSDDSSDILGIKFTNKSDPSKYILLPTTRVYNNSNFMFGDGGYYWTSEIPPTNKLCPWFFYFYADYEDGEFGEGVSAGDNKRCHGLCVRPVYNPS